MLSLTSEKYNYMRAKQATMKEEGLRLIGDEEIPVLPDMKDFLQLPPPYEESAQRMELSTPAALDAPPANEIDKPDTEIQTQSKTQQMKEAESEKLPELELPPFIGEEDAGRLPQ